MRLLPVPCLLFAAAALAHQVAPENDQLATLAGVVLNAATKEPVRKAHVALAPSGAAQAIQLLATTDDTGHFRFAEVTPGRYILVASKNGFLASSYGSTKPLSQGSLLSVAKGDRMQDLTLSLFPGAAISGQIFDADGEPIPGQVVILSTRSGRRGELGDSIANSTNTNRSGEYRFDNLAPGTYYVSANVDVANGGGGQVHVDSSGKPTKVRDLTTFHPSALSPSDAAAITLENGREATGIDVHIQRGLVLSVHGKIVGATLKYSLASNSSQGWGTSSPAATILPGGDFVLTDLPPGKHRLILTEESGPNGNRVVGQTDVTLADQDLTGILITPFKPAQAHVRVVMEGEEQKPLPDKALFFVPADPPDLSLSNAQAATQNGILFFDSIRPGKYCVLPAGTPDSYYKWLQSGDRTLDSHVIDIADGAQLDLRVILSKNGASLTGDVERPQNQAPLPVQALLVPQSKSDALFGSGNHTLALDQSLHFSTTNLPPGKYTAFATEEEDSELWENAEFLNLVQSQGTPIELHEREQANLHLKLIPKDETDRIRKQLGL